ncbi:MULTISPECIES: hypothetical protein [unclassified Mesorhizobium]|uniref:hypothetical protein n=1 Tax=unclassified Mesorhizobium TaxID=325217 RepID=UPI00112AA079|nr:MULTISPECIES: hypothetical protein [unclassified Mesorhizobium]TPN51335.1 hypothetical protein FJ978_13460 [Mesorhizobium sp. B1-1-7]TPN56595.1 hypothetical protein FJ976_06090 [Mesorhizobium sp. B1-1-9]
MTEIDLERPVAVRKIDKDRHERTSLVARELLEAERLARQAKTARLREQRLAGTPAGKPPPSAANLKPSRKRTKNHGC